MTKNVLQLKKACVENYMGGGINNVVISININCTPILKLTQHTKFSLENINIQSVIRLENWGCFSTA